MSKIRDAIIMMTDAHTKILHAQIQHETQGQVPKLNHFQQYSIDESQKKTPQKQGSPTKK